MKKITFTNISDYADLEVPKPASRYIPEWYKEMQSYMNGKRQPMGNGTNSATIKKCMPVFDAITSGYIIELPADVYVSQRDGEPWYEWSLFTMIQFHPVEQAPSHPKRNDMPQYPKFTNLWSIETPPGYSCLFVQPFHREAPFTILPGIVDTDSYTPPVNFPFVLNNRNFEGIIPKGTPIAQVIPFKRDSWQIDIGDKKNFNKQFNVAHKINQTFFDAYKNLFWNKKEYK